MNHTSWRTDYLRSQLIAATAYGKKDGRYFIDMPKENVYGNGGLITTATDLTTWNNYLMAGKFGYPSLLWKQLYIPALTSERKYNYAAGLRVDTFNGHMRISHDGATAAYRSLLELYPDEKISIAWLSNSSEFDGGGEGLAELRNFLIPKSVTPINKSIKSESSSEKPETNNLRPTKGFTSFAAVVGDYHSDEISSDLKIKVKDNELFILRKNGERFMLTPASGLSFKIADSNIYVEFFLNDRNQATGFYFHSPKIKKIAFDKVN
jgi:CubicO group peptidase (beta-lactamase class C family)